SANTSGYITCYNCVLYTFGLTGSVVSFYNCANAYPVSSWDSQSIFHAGYMTDVSGPTNASTAELENTCDYIIEKGFVMQGVGLFIGNRGYARIYDGAIFDAALSQGGAISVGNSELRLEIFWGSNNQTHGVYVNSNARVMGNLAQTTIAGTIASVCLCGVSY